jgi:hypothetical protein
MAPAWIMGAELAAAVAVLGLGAVTAWSSANAAKRLAGLQLALLGACIGLAAIEAPPTFVLVGIAVSVAHLALGLAIVVRMQEGYGSVETPDVDAADKQSEPVESER